MKLSIQPSILLRSDDKYQTVLVTYSCMTFHLKTLKLHTLCLSCCASGIQTLFMQVLYSTISHRCGWPSFAILSEGYREGSTSKLSHVILSGFNYWKVMELSTSTPFIEAVSYILMLLDSPVTSTHLPESLQLLRCLFLFAYIRVNSLCCKILQVLTNV